MSIEYIAHRLSQRIIHLLTIPFTIWGDVKDLHDDYFDKEQEEIVDDGLSDLGNGSYEVLK